jgi:microcompartment protein CcmK/EutM
MMLARVIGRVVATAKHPALDGRKLLLLQPVTREGAARGRPLVAVDAIGAGFQETVYWCRGREASLAFGSGVLADAAVVGIVDPVASPAARSAGAAGSAAARTRPGAPAASSAERRAHPKPAARKPAHRKP